MIKKEDKRACVTAKKQNTCSKLKYKGEKEHVFPAMAFKQWREQAHTITKAAEYPIKHCMHQQK